ncbi:hypothetical protein [Glaciecola sp. SC05]|uniref:hypothetical protein n=1 Tax=Glaciecola sp. SC05 TaxID=1987355 RepID=UPI0035295F72
MSNKDIDKLKDLSKSCEPDYRQKYFSTTLEIEHDALSQTAINETAPRTTVQLFETAKNLSLYSWFVYRFHQVSELIAFSALEVALKEKYLLENPSGRSEKKQGRLTLFKLLEYGKKNQWIKNEGFSSLYRRARRFAEEKKNREKAEAHDFEKEPEMFCEEPTAQEIDDALRSIDLVSAVTENTNKHRNNLAHGSNTLQVIKS